MNLAVIAAAAAAAFTGCGSAGTPPATHTFPVWEHTLPSGLRVVIEKDDTSGLAGVVAIVDVGMVDDPPGKAGLAHTLEHLVFRMPDAEGQSLWNRFFKLGAASFNGTTAMDRTTYHAFGPRRTLDELVAAVVGRLADPLRGASADLLAKEHSIVAEEMRLREGASGSEVMMPELMPTGHPYARAYRELRASGEISLADLRAFADRNYRPERMTIVISGPVPSDYEQTVAAKLPPSLRGAETEHRAPVRRPLAVFAGPARAETDLPSREAKVEEPELWMAWRVPPAAGVAAGRLGVMARMVERVLDGRLDPEGANDVLDVGAWALPGVLGSAIVCRLGLRAAGDATRIRNETREALEALADATLVQINGRLWWGYQGALQEATLRTALGMESIEGRALARADLEHAGSGPLISQVLNDLEKITVEDVATFAGQYLRPEATRAVLLLPDQTRTAARVGQRRANRMPVASEPPPVPEGDVPANDASDDLPNNLDLAILTQAPGTRGALVRKLSNGLTVIALRRGGLPFASMRLGFHADPQPGDAPGARAAVTTARRWDLSAGPMEVGVWHWSDIGTDSYQESLTMFSSNVGKAFEFLSQEGDTLHIFWPNPAFDRWADRVAIEEGTPEERAARAFRDALFGAHLYHLTPTAAAARKVTGPQAETWFERVRRPANGALVIVGEIDPEAVVREAEGALHGWKGPPAPPPAPPAPPPPAGPRAPGAVRVAGLRVATTIDPRRQSASLHFGCFLPPVQSYRDEVANSLLASVLGNELFGRLRWNMAANYGHRFEARSVRGGTAWLEGSFDLDRRSVAEALELVHDWLASDHPFVIDPARFERRRWEIARASGLRNETGQELAASIFAAWNMGWGPEVLDDYPEALARVTIADLQRRMELCRPSAVVQLLDAEDAPGSAVGSP